MVRKTGGEGNTQKGKFIKAARELGADKDPTSFDRALKKVSRAPPPEKRHKPPTKKPAD